MANDKTIEKTLLLDADILVYSIGGLKDQDGNPEQWPILVTMFETMVENMLRETKCSKIEMFITADDKTNFRIEKASIKPYKGHRSSSKPYHYQTLRNYFESLPECVTVRLKEADDELGKRLIDLGDNAVLASKDKDLDMIPGWHYNWAKKLKYKVSEVDGLRSFWRQVLTGDSTDNIPGLYGVGLDGATAKKINTFEDELDMYRHVQQEYEKRFGSYWKLFLEENAILLWILRSDNLNEARERLNDLESRRLSTEASLSPPSDTN